MSKGKLSLDVGPGDACRARCLLNATCDELREVFCYEEGGASLIKCSEACEYGEPFQCEDGANAFRCDAVTREVAAECDGDDDCLDGSDEVRCLAPNLAFDCGDYSYVSLRDVCNGKPDCEDGSDEEQGCAELQCDKLDPRRPLEPGPEDEMSLEAERYEARLRERNLLSAGYLSLDFGPWDSCCLRCVHAASCQDLTNEVCSPFGSRAIWDCATVCDLEEECADGSDEHDCPASTYFLCSDGERVPPYAKCNREPTARMVPTKRTVRRPSPAASFATTVSKRGPAPSVMASGSVTTARTNAAAWSVG